MTVPVDPDAPEARDWVLRELANREYAEAQPTWFDRLATALWEWLSSLRFDPGAGGQGLGVLLVVLLLIALLVAAYFIFGRPAFSRRSGVSGELFGDDDERDAAAMRRAAERSASEGRWNEAVADMFRAIARGLAERTVVSTLPGTTAQDFAVRARRAFPEHSAALAASADDFDSVRYLDRDATRHEYDRVAALEATLRTARPDLDAVGAQTAGSRS